MRCWSKLTIEYPLTWSQPSSSQESIMTLKSGIMVRMWRILYCDHLWVGVHLWRQLHKTSHSSQWRATGRKLVCWCRYNDRILWWWWNYKNVKVGVRNSRWGQQFPLLWPGLSHTGHFTNIPENHTDDLDDEDDDGDKFNIKRMMIFIGPESDHWLCLSVTDWLTNSLTPV